MMSFVNLPKKKDAWIESICMSEIRDLASKHNLTPVEHVALLEIACAFWTSKGDLPDDDKAIKRISHLSDRQWARSRDKLKAACNGNWTFTELGIWISKYTGISAVRREAAISKASKAKASPTVADNATVAQAYPVADKERAHMHVHEAQDIFGDMPEPGKTVKAVKPPKAVKNAMAVYDDTFLRFWSAYPARQGGSPKAEALKIFTGLIAAGVDHEIIIAGATAYANHARATGNIGSVYIAQATTWLNQKRWDTDYTVIPQVPTVQIKPRKISEAALALEQSYQRATMNRPHADIELTATENEQPKPLKLILVK